MPKNTSLHLLPQLEKRPVILKSGQGKLRAEDATVKSEEPHAHKVTRGTGYYKGGITMLRNEAVHKLQEMHLGVMIGGL